MHWVSRRPFDFPHDTSRKIVYQSLLMRCRDNAAFNFWVARAHRLRFTRVFVAVNKSTGKPQTAYPWHTEMALLFGREKRDSHIFSKSKNEPVPGESRQCD